MCVSPGKVCSKIASTHDTDMAALCLWNPSVDYLIILTEIAAFASLRSEVQHRYVFHLTKSTRSSVGVHDVIGFVESVCAHFLNEARNCDAHLM